MSMYDEAIDLTGYDHVSWKWLFNGNGLANTSFIQSDPDKYKFLVLSRPRVNFWCKVEG